MLITPQVISVRWYPKLKKYYIEKGYSPYEHLKYFNCNILDLHPNSTYLVKIKCDFCDKDFKRSYYLHNQHRNRSVCKKDCCNSKVCQQQKLEEANMIKYQTKSTLSIKEVIDKSSYTINKNKQIRLQTIVSDFLETHKHINTINLERDVDELDYNSKIRYFCSNHMDYGEKFITPLSMQLDHDCFHCQIDKKKHSFDFVKDKFEEMGFLLVDAEYKNSNTPLKCICKNHPEITQEKTISKILEGHGCKYCFYDGKKRENNHNWKGGVSPLHNFLRAKINNWKKDSLKYYDFKCVISGQKHSRLEVHHIYSFESILKETLNELTLPIYSSVSEYSDDELKMIEQLLVDKHNEYGYGVPLLPDIHALFHNIYGKGNNTQEQFTEFSTNFISGKYDL